MTGDIILITGAARALAERWLKPFTQPATSSSSPHVTRRRSARWSRQSRMTSILLDVADTASTERLRVGSPSTIPPSTC